MPVVVAAVAAQERAAAATLRRSRLRGYTHCESAHSRACGMIRRGQDFQPEHSLHTPAKSTQFHTNVALNHEVVQRAAFVNLQLCY